MGAVAPTESLDAGGVLSPRLTPRPDFHITRRLVAVSRYPLILLTAIYAIQQTHQFLLPVLFPFIKEEFRLSDAALGILGGSYILMLTLGMVPFGILADRVRRTWVIGWGTTAYSFAMLYSGLAPTFAHLLAGRTLLGVADPANNPTSQSLLADYYPLNQRAKVMSIYEAGRLLGIVALPLVGYIAIEWGWRAAFFFFSIPGFVVAMLAWGLPEPERGIQERRHQNIEGGGTASVYDHMSSLRAFGACLRIPTFLVSLISSGIAGFFFGGAGIWAVTFMVRYHDMEVSTASAAISLFALGALVGSLAGGYVADHLKHIGIANARIYVAGAGRLLAFGIMMFTFSTNNTALMLILLTVGSAVLVAPVPVLNAVRADVLHPKLRGRGNSLDAMAQAIAAAASPILLGILSDQFGLRAALLTILPIVGIAGLLLLVLGPAFYRSDEERVLRQVADEMRGSPPQGGDGGGSSLGVEPSDNGSRGEPGTRPRNDAIILDVEDVDFSYGPLRTLFGTSLEVPRGKCVAILGPNGAGKTTFLRVLSGVLEPQAGRIWFNGVDLVGVPPEQRARLGISLMAGGRSTFPSLSVADNLWLGAYPFTESRRLVEQRLDAVLDVFPVLRPRLGQAGGTLSGGEQQMMALGRALMAGAEVLLIDELSMGLAPVVIEDLSRVVAEIKSLGTTLVVVEQSVKVALRLADEVYLMEKGELRALGAAAGLGDLDEEQLARIVFGNGEEPAPKDKAGRARKKQR